MSEPLLFPDLPLSVDARIVLALKAKLEADPALGVVRDAGKIWCAELRQLLELDSLGDAPLLAVCLLADEEKEFTSSQGGILEVVTELALFTKIPVEFGSTDDFLRSRLVAAIRRVVRSNGGQLVEEDGTLLTEAVVRITRVNYDRSVLPSGLLLTLIQVVYRSWVELQTQEVIE